MAIHWCLFSRIHPGNETPVTDALRGHQVEKNSIWSFAVTSFPLLDQMCHGVGLRLLGAAGFPPGAAGFVRTDESRPEWHLRADSCTFSQTSTSVPPEPHEMPWTPTNTTSTKQNIQTTRWQYNDISKEMQLLYITIYIRHQVFSTVALEVNFPWTLIKHTWTSSSMFLGLLESYRQLSLIRVWEKDCWKVDLRPDFRSPVLYITAKVYMKNTVWFLINMMHEEQIETDVGFQLGVFT